MQTTKYETVTYDGFFSAMEKAVGCEYLWEALSYNDSFFEDRIPQFIDLGHNFAEAMEEHNKGFGKKLTEVMDAFMLSKGITTILII